MDDDKARRAGLLSVSKEQFVAQLRDIPVGPSRVRDARLRKLVSRFRRELENCNDEIPCDLSRRGFQSSMSFDDFIYAVTYR